jgi:anti-sigma regulatory factor (Ser/Thr protein kinase)
MHPETTRTSRIIDITFKVSSHLKRLTRLRQVSASCLDTMFSKKLSQQLMLAIDEMLQNAYEHGNLEIPFEEKRKLIDSGSFDSTLVQKEKMFGTREILLSISVSEKEIRIYVKNEGPGFEWKKFMPDASCRKDTQEVHHEPSGNGFLLLSGIADEFFFEEDGRLCIIKKNLSKEDFIF